MSKLKATELLSYLNQLLEPESFVDYCPNGLQVEGSKTISTVVIGVTACQPLIDAAIELNADAIIVHHGYFWKNESASIVGIKRARIGALLQHNINLFAYHIPLDAHQDYGNNVQLANVLDLNITGQLQAEPLVFTGELPKPMSGDKFANLIAERLGREPQHINTNDRPITKLAWCTGAAQGFIQHAVDANVDAYITGEISEQTVHIARENNLHFFAAGHHATERYGVKAIGEHLAKHFNITHHFIDIDNPA